MSKIINRFYIKPVLLLFFLTKLLANYAQDKLLNKHGLWVIGSEKEYQASVKTDSLKEMIDLKKLVPELEMELRYACNNNFMKTRLYSATHSTYLRRPAAIALAAVQKELKKRGLGLKIFDAYRPYAISEKMWELVKDERYVADPKKGSGHNRGIAVDLTIINYQNKQPLCMGTDFDNFSDTAHHNFMGLSKRILENRSLLRSMMEKYGFKALDTEWWHYSFSTGVAYELLDLSFDVLSKNKF